VPGEGPGAHRPDRAGAAHRAPRLAVLRSEIEHGLVVGPAATDRHEGVGESLGLGPPEGPAGGGARQHPCGVGVDDADVAFEGERQHRPRRVRSDPGQGDQVGQLVGDATAVTLADPGRGGVQLQGPAVVTESGPEPDHLTGGGGGAGGRIGEASEESRPGPDDPGHLRLLQHGLAHEHRPRVAGRAPRELAPAVRSPLAHHFAQPPAEWTLRGRTIGKRTVGTRPVGKRPVGTRAAPPGARTTWHAVHRRRPTGPARAPNPAAPAKITRP
jgi:hypothetical protein